jgi:hypothetical protein
MFIRTLHVEFSPSPFLTSGLPCQDLLVQPQGPALEGEAGSEAWSEAWKMERCLERSLENGAMPGAKPGKWSDAWSEAWKMERCLENGAMPYKEFETKGLKKKD